jgi:hypothetical protein
MPAHEQVFEQRARNAVRSFGVVSRMWLTCVYA